MVKTTRPRGPPSLIVILVISMMLLLAIVPSTPSWNVIAFSSILSSLSKRPIVMDRSSSVSPSMLSTLGRSVTAFSSSSFTRQETELSATEPYFLNEDEGWMSLSETRGVWWKKNTPGKEQTTSRSNISDDSITIKYSGTLVGEDWWSPVDVADCWLKEIQGMDVYVDKVLEEKIDASLLMDPDRFTESFVSSTFGIDNKIQCKKFVMAAKRLQKVREEFEVGTLFDSNDRFEVDKNRRLIKGMRLAVDKMMEMMTVPLADGESSDENESTSSISIVCRSDFAYGSEGLRKSNGDVIVPPFATLRFDVERLS